MREGLDRRAAQAWLAATSTVDWSVFMTLTYRRPISEYAALRDPKRFARELSARLDQHVLVLYSGDVHPDGQGWHWHLLAAPWGRPALLAPTLLQSAWRACAPTRHGRVDVREFGTEPRHESGLPYLLFKHRDPMIFMGCTRQPCCRRRGRGCVEDRQIPRALAWS